MMGNMPPAAKNAFEKGVLYESLIKNIEKSACLRRLKPFFEEGFKNPKNFKKEMIQDTRGQQV